MTALLLLTCWLIACVFVPLVLILTQDPPAEVRRVDRALLGRQLGAWVERWPESERARLKVREFGNRYAAPTSHAAHLRAAAKLLTVEEAESLRKRWAEQFPNVVAWQDVMKDATRDAAQARWSEYYTDEEVKS